MMQIRASKSWVPSLLLLLLWAGNAQAVPCQNNLPASNPDAVYIDHGNGTVTDTRTGLKWKQCAEGLSGATCQTGTALSFTWANALAHAEASTFASDTDWRLPNVKELSSLVEDCRAVPAINTNRFPNTPSSSFWSGSPDAYVSSYAWGVYFDVGYAYSGNRSNFVRVRLVRGGGYGTGSDPPVACGPVPDNVIFMSDWLVEGTTSTGRYDLGGETKSFAFNTTGGSVASGRLETAPTLTNPRTRATWISQCPGGVPLDQVGSGINPCISTGYEVTSVRWSDTDALQTCRLQPNAHYYLNVRSATSWDAPEGNCNAANCPFYGQKTIQ